jgi:hypothetical protein
MRPYMIAISRGALAAIQTFITLLIAVTCESVGYLERDVVHAHRPRVDADIRKREVMILSETESEADVPARVDHQTNRLLRKQKKREKTKTEKTKTKLSLLTLIVLSRWVPLSKTLCQKVLQTPQTPQMKQMKQMKQTRPMKQTKQTRLMK